MKKVSKKFETNTFQSLFVLLAIVFSVSYVSCSGGGGGNDVDDDNGDFTGGSGVGANGVVTFWRYYPSAEGAVGTAKAVLETSGNDFLIAGSQGDDFDFAHQDIHLIRTDSSGISTHEKTVDLPGGSVANDIVETANGDVTAVGYAGSDALIDLVLLSTDADFVQKWLKHFGGGLGNDAGYALLKAQDGYLMVGSSLRNDPPRQYIWRFKTDDNGTFLPGSERLYGGLEESVGHDVVATSDGGYAIAGGNVEDTGEGVTLAAYLVKTDASGNEEWHKSYGIGRIHSLQQTEDDGYVLTGINAPWEGEPHSTNDLLVIKTDAAGNEEWRRTFGGADIDVGKKVLLSDDGNYLIVGTTLSFSSGDLPHLRQDIYLIKLDPEGNTVWQKVKGMFQSDENAQTATLTSDGGFVVTGSGYGRIMAAKFDANGDTITLGDKDFTLTVPETLTAISYANAADVAGSAKTVLTLPQEVGSFALQRYIDALNGDSPAEFCDGGGSYSWNPAVTEAVPANGATYTLTMAACVSGSGIDQLIFNGNTTLTFAQDTTGTLGTADYGVGFTLHDIAITFSDSAGSLSIAGATQFARTAAGGTFSEFSQQAASPLSQTEGNSTVSLNAYVINDTVTAATYSIGQNGNSADFTVTGIDGTLTLAVETAIAGSAIDSPLSGAFTTTADDNSTLHLTVTDGTAAITVDTDADGVTDFSTSKPWEDLQ
ncbi:hypothetical protein [Sulfurimonas sp. HSL3-7]|uniref:hypothetical protein n=1 Tax=Sulfonitrofixus jiaomeiensis TaxID=3131938 RepID=UPI0031F93F22